MDQMRRGSFKGMVVAAAVVLTLLGVSAARAADVLVDAGLASLARKDYTAAIDDFTRAVRSKGSSADYFLLGYAYYQRGFLTGDPDTADKQDAVEAINAYTTAQALDPKLRGVTEPYKLYHSLGLCYEALGNYDKAIDAYRKAFTAAPNNAMLPLYAARLRFRMNDTKKAANNLDLALKKAKERGQLKGLLSMLEKDPLFSVMLTSDESLAVAKRYDPRARAPETAVVASAAGTPMAQATGVMRDSIKNAGPAANDRYAALRRQDRDVLDALSAANDQLKFRKYREAVNGYNDALALNRKSGILNPTEVAFIYEKIGTAYNKLGLSDTAIQALRRCVEQAPMDTAAHYQLSLAYAVLGRYQDSVHALSDALKSAPTTAELRRFTLLAKTDSELEGVRDLPAFKAVLDENRSRLHDR